MPVGNGLFITPAIGVRPPSLLLTSEVLLLNPAVCIQSLLGLTM